MINFKPAYEKTELQVVRTDAINELKDVAADSEEYQKIMAHVKSLTELINSERREKLNPNTLAIVAGNLGVAGLVLWFERDNVMSTKLFPFLTKAQS